jgi:hypothetical protein
MARSSERDLSVMICRLLRSSSLRRERETPRQFVVVNWSVWIRETVSVSAVTSVAAHLDFVCLDSYSSDSRAVNSGLPYRSTQLSVGKNESTALRVG